MNNITARLNKAADQLHDKALVAATQGRAIVWCLTPDDAENLSRWLRAELHILHGGEDHTLCDPEECAPLAALEFLSPILKENR